MSTYVYMKLLESAPERYDRGIRILSRGMIDKAYGRVAERVASPGKRILDIGCGTGGVTLACAARGAEVVGIDINPAMLEVARSKSVPRAGSVEWVELGAMEIEDEFAEEAFDAVVACLLFSELAAQEQSYVLGVVHSRLKPGGVLVVADEVLPRTRACRLWHRFRRLPRAALTYALTQTTTRPVEHLPRQVREAGFAEVEEQRLEPGDISIVSGVKVGRRA
ncbi:MAG: corrinoid protein-associated methyltransferase CpaM [Planctomycetota bacterium]|jgi:demethylmenaquinone methyltransferase/2-methoxy-6-polyprenyl-1,4-benzoquinol methylase